MERKTQTVVMVLYETISDDPSRLAHLTLVASEAWKDEKR